MGGITGLVGGDRPGEGESDLEVDLEEGPYDLRRGSWWGRRCGSVYPGLYPLERL